MADASKLPLALDDFKRYGRQMVLENFGLSAQIKLQDASVVVVGGGGLGCPALLYLAAAGVGRIAIIDHDTVDLSNLQRQILHNEQTVGMYKTESAAKAIRQINSALKVDPITVPLIPSNASTLLKDYDVILDCTDNAPTRYCRVAPMPKHENSPHSNPTRARSVSRQELSTGAHPPASTIHPAPIFANRHAKTSTLHLAANSSVHEPQEVQLSSKSMYYRSLKSPHSTASSNGFQMDW